MFDIRTRFLSERRLDSLMSIDGIHPNDQGEYSADWTWLLHLSLIGEFVRVPEVLCEKYYKPGSLSKQWPHDPVQLAALRRAGVDEIRRSPADWLWLNRKWKYRKPLYS